MRKKWLQKAVAVVASALIIFTGIPMLTISASATGTDWTGYTAVSTKAELNAIRNNLSGNYYLTGDIVFSAADFASGGAFYNGGAGWKPIGTSDTSAFSGIFDGNGHTISGLYIDLNTSSDTYAGLFGYSKGTIKNLGMIGGSITVFSSSNTNDVHAYAGGIAGYADGSIDHCYSTGSVQVTTEINASSDIYIFPASYAGGIAGKSSKTINNSYNTGNVNASSGPRYAGAYAGGIAAESSIITNCYNNGDVDAYSGNYYTNSYAGGISGSSSNFIVNCHNTGRISSVATMDEAGAGGISGTNYGTIRFCYNTGSVSVPIDYQYAGGIAGYNYYDPISDCYNTGEVSAPIYAGGIVGKNTENIDNIVTRCYNAGVIDSYSGGGGIAGFNGSTISNCYYLDNISSGAYSGADTSIKCTLNQLKQQQTFTDFDFNSVWLITAGNLPEVRDIPLYTVSFDYQNGWSLRNIIATYNESVTQPQPYPPTKTGYTFAGWYTQASGGTQVAFPYTVTEDVTLYAHWAAASACTATFDSQGGSTVPSQTVAYNSAFSEPTPPTRAGYTFSGWYLTTTGSYSVSFPYYVTGNVTFYAHWTANNYTVSYNSNGGSSVASASAGYNAAITSPTAPLRNGYFFDGWFTAASGGTKVTFPYTVTSNTTFYAQWILATGNLLTNGDFETPTGVSDNGEMNSNYISGCYASTLVTDPKFKKWFRVGDGNKDYHDSIQMEDGSGVNHIGKVAQTLLQGGFALENGKSYEISFRAKAGAVTGTPIIQHVGVALYDATDNITAGTGKALALKTESIVASVVNSANQTAAGGITAVGTAPNSYFYAPLYQDGWYTYHIKFTLADNAITSGHSYGMVFSTDSQYSTSWYYMYIDNVLLSAQGTYTTTFDSQGGTAVTSQTATYNTTIATPTSPTKTGYTFAGWYTASSGGTKITFPYTVTADTTLYAQWTVNTYTITFNSNGGTAVTSKTAAYNTTISAPTNPTKTGYTFAGWYTAPSGGTKITFPYTVLTDTTLYAQWTGNFYTVNFDSNGGSLVASKTATYNTTITTPANPTKTGYTFAGWYTASSGGTKVLFPYTVTADSTLYAQWTANTYTVTFNSNGGTAVTSQTVAYNTTTAAPANPTKTGYTFAGWYTASSGGTKITFPYTVMADATLYAQWTVNTYTVTFNSNGGTAVDSQTAVYNTTTTEPTNPTKTGYTFGGWYTAATGGSKISFPYVVTENIILYAQWTINTYTVTFDSNGGSPVSSKTADYYTYITAPTDPTQTGYTFAGWFTASSGGTKITFPYTVLADTTLYAQWTVDTYTVTFNSNGGSTVASQTAVYNTTTTEPANPTKTGYTFAGWYTTSSGGSKITFPYTVTADTTLYAQWAVNTYTVTFNSNGGTAVASQKAEYNTTTTEPANPTKTGYSFAGWYTAPSGGTKITFPYTVMADTTLYAQWTVNTYTVTFNSNGGTAVASQTAEYNTTTTAPTDPTQTGYTFAGWFTAANGGTKITFPYTVMADTTLYAQWTVDTYTITFNSNGGTAVASQTAEYNTTTTEPANPTKTGYTFAGWYTAPSGGTKIVFPYTVEADITLYAQWTVNSYTVTFNSNGGTAVASQTAVYNTTTTEPTNPTKTGYTFGGWYTAATGGTKVTFPYAVTENITLYAQWTINNYTVTFNPNGGYYSPDLSIPTVVGCGQIIGGFYVVTVPYNIDIFTPPVPTKSGFKLDGWYTQPVGGTKVTSFPYTVTENATFYAHWTLENFTVTFDSNGGSPVSSKTADYYTYITAPTDPTQTGYTFAGWFSAASGGSKITFPYTVMSDTTLYAQWTVNTYVITFNSNGGTAVAAKISDYNTAITAPAVPIQTGYTFAGWYTASSGGSKITFPYTVTNTMTLYALWTVNSYTVTFHSNGGTAVDSKTADYSTAISAPADPIKTDYTFAGWYTAASGGSKVSFPYTVTADTALYAMWTVNTYTVTFNTNGGTVVDSETVDYSTTISAPQDPTKAGYLFAGWYTEATGGTKITFPYTVLSDTVLYAQWSHIPGNIDGDNSVDLKDVTTLSRFVAGWQGVTVIPEALDVNGDGQVDLIDVTMLSRFVAGWNVIIQ